MRKILTKLPHQGAVYVEDPAGKSSNEQCVLPRSELVIVCVGIVGVVASCLLLVIEEEAA